MAVNNVATVVGASNSLQSAVASQGDVVIAEGYATPGDGGGGQFFLEQIPPTSASTISGAAASTIGIINATNAIPIEIETSAAHGFQSGQSVLIQGVTGDTAANDTWLIDVVSITKFTLRGSAGNGTYISGGSASSVVITIAAAHGLSSGHRLAVAGVVWGGGAGINGVWNYAGVLSSTTISIGAATTGVYTGGGVIGDNGLIVPLASGAGRWVRLFNSPSFNPRWWGAADNVYVDGILSTIIAEMAADGGAILIDGKFNLARDLVLNKPIVLSGTGVDGHGWLSLGTGKRLHIVYPGGIGSRVENIVLACSPVVASGWQASTAYAVGAVVYPTARNGFHLVCITAGTSGPSEPIWNIPDGETTEESLSPSIPKVKWVSRISAGILVHAIAAIDQVLIANATDAGIFVYGNLSTNPPTGANGTRITGCQILTCRGDGISLLGADANGCVILSNIIQDCSGYGIRNKSFLSNLIAGNITEGNVAGGYWSANGVAQAVLVGNYAESDQPPNVIASPSIWVGGQNANGFSADSNGVLWDGNMFWNGIPIHVPSTVPLFLQFGYPARQAAIALKRASEIYDLSLLWDDTNKWWEWKWAGLNGFDSMHITGPDAVRGPNRIEFPDGFFGGRSTSQRRMVWMDAVPSAASSSLPRLWQQGDIVWNVSPSAGGTAGWICTATGGWGGGRFSLALNYAAGITFARGDGIEPSAPKTTGYVYRCIGVPAPEGASTTSASEPASWPTTIGQTVTDAVGLVWECFGPVGATFKTFATISS